MASEEKGKAKGMGKEKEAEPKVPAPDPEDEDLSELLDSAIQDFGKGGGAETSSGEEPQAIMIDQAAAQAAAGEFQAMLRQLAELQKQALTKPPPTSSDAEASTPGGAGPAMGPIAQAVASAGLAEGAAAPSAAPALDPPISAEEEAAFAENLIKNLQGLADKAQKVTEAQGEEEFMAAMSDMHNNEAYTQEFLPFMQGLMGSLLSKDMMYPSLKEMTEKYPKWLEENAEKISKEDKERFQIQLQLMSEAVAEYEAETEQDSEEVVHKRFERLIHIMQKMQLCGHPPEDLVGQLPQGWALGDDGLPKVTDQAAAAENCVLM